MDQVLETENELKETVSKKKGISGSTIKLIAIIAMLIDHTGAIILERMLMLRGMGSIASNEQAMAFMAENAGLYYADMALRTIGRIGFPIFCFLLIEGFLHTRNMVKYMGRLFLFAVVSEIPFDLAFAGKAFYFGYQNVFFTLLIGLLVIAGFRLIEQKQEWYKAYRVLLYVMMLSAGIVAGNVLRTDYSGFGVLTIVVMYLFRRGKVRSAAMGCVTLSLMSLSELPAFLSLIPIRLYNGTRGFNIKWLFYVFYPAHILILYLIAYAIGLGEVSLRF